MSFLSKLSTLRKTTPEAPRRVNIPKPEPDDPTKISLLPKNYIRDEDPAIKRLKELRRKEQLKNGELNKDKPKKRASPGSKLGKRNVSEDSESDKIGTIYKKKIGANTSYRRSNMQDQGFVPKKREPIKKMSFEELMKQAENNTQNNVNDITNEQNKKSTSIKRDVERTKILNKPGFKNKSANKVVKPRDLERGQNINKNTVPSRQHPTKASSHEPEPIRISLPKNKFAQPNARIKQRLEKNKQRHGKHDYDEESGDSELDDFIEDDEEEEETGYYREDQRSRARGGDVGYDRDEIWAMFNKGKSRSAYVNRDYEEDYDDFDDMEANEMEIMEEEDYATRMARLEDKREEAWLKKHEAEKRKKKR